MLAALPVTPPKLMRTLSGFFCLLMVFALFAGCAPGMAETVSPALLTDQEVGTILQNFPYLGDYTDSTSTPEDILQQIMVDPTTLEVLEQYEGDCLSFKTYQLSPNYVLIVDHNACSGYRVSIVKNQDR